METKVNYTLVGAFVLGLSALLAGRVEEGPRQVILEPVEVSFAGEELELS